MSDLLGLGVADGESRWIGVRRHQAGLAIAGLGLIGEWITQAHGALIEVVTGVALLACAAPTSDGLTVGERVRIGVDFAVRSRWTSVRASLHHGSLTVVAHGEATTRGFELQHRGRLDLSGRDLHNALALSEFADAMATSDDTRHFSLHVRTSPTDVATLLVVPPNVSAPPGWRENPGLALAAAGAGVTWLMERWSYVRDATGVTRVLRVRDFSAVPHGHALLERLQFAAPTLDVVVHVDVVGGVRAHRLAARAVHRVGSDDVTSRAAGFRRTAQSTRALERLRQRESLVVEGTALLRIAVFVVVRSASLQQLRRDVKAVTRSALEAGLRCESGLGQQSAWYCAQLPGAPGW
ncbi:MAG TPA: hypothetical protein VIJ08_02400 [Acidimicrobiales bacterium]